MEATNKIVKMLQSIDSHLDRTMQKASLSYDKATLSEIIKKGYVTVIGNKVTRKYHSTNYQVYS